MSHERVRFLTKRSSQKFECRLLILLKLDQAKLNSDEMWYDAIKIIYIQEIRKKLHLH